MPVYLEQAPLPAPGEAQPDAGKTELTQAGSAQLLLLSQGLRVKRASVSWHC